MRRLPSFIPFMLTLAMAAGCTPDAPRDGLRGPRDVPDGKPREALLVLPFKVEHDANERRLRPELGQAIADRLVREAVNQGVYKVVDPYLAGKTVAPADTDDPAKVIELASKVRCACAVTGRIRPDGNGHFTIIGYRFDKIAASAATQPAGAVGKAVSDPPAVLAVTDVDAALDQVPALAFRLNLRDRKPDPLEGQEMTVEQAERFVRPLSPSVATTMRQGSAALPPLAVALRTVEDKDLYLEGEPIQFEVEVSRDCYLTLLYANPEGKILRLWPNKYSRDSLVRKGRNLVPAPRTFVVRAMGAPFGAHFVKALATAQPVNVEEAVPAAPDVPLPGEKSIWFGHHRLVPKAAAVFEGQLEWATAEKLVFTAPASR